MKDGMGTCQHLCAPRDAACGAAPPPGCTPAGVGGWTHWDVYGACIAGLSRPQPADPCAGGPDHGLHSRRQDHGVPLRPAAALPQGASGAAKGAGVHARRWRKALIPSVPRAHALTRPTGAGCRSRKTLGAQGRPWVASAACWCVRLLVQQALRLPAPIFATSCVPWGHLRARVRALRCTAIQDDDPYVRKTAAVCVAKLYDINPELVEDRGFLDMLRVRPPGAALLGGGPEDTQWLQVLQQHARKPGHILQQSACIRTGAALWGSGTGAQTCRRNVETRRLGAGRCKSPCIMSLRKWHAQPATPKAYTGRRCARVSTSPACTCHAAVPQGKATAGRAGYPVCELPLLTAALPHGPCCIAVCAACCRVRLTAAPAGHAERCQPHGGGERAGGAAGTEQAREGGGHGWRQRG